MPVARHLLVASLSLFAAAAGAAQTHYAWVGTYNPNGEGLYRFYRRCQNRRPAR